LGSTRRLRQYSKAVWWLTNTFISLSHNSGTKLRLCGKYLRIFYEYSHFMVVYSLFLADTYLTNVNLCHISFLAYRSATSCSLSIFTIFVKKKPSLLVY
jgi:hypothetical protein